MSEGEADPGEAPVEEPLPQTQADNNTASNNDGAADDPPQDSPDATLPTDTDNTPEGIPDTDAPPVNTDTPPPPEEPTDPVNTDNIPNSENANPNDAPALEVEVVKEENETDVEVEAARLDIATPQDGPLDFALSPDEEASATKIQCAYRSRAARKEVAGKRSQQRLISNAARKKSVDRELDLAATRIQSLHRGRQARKTATNKKTTRRITAKRENAAATKIQAVQRGRAARRTASRKKSADPIATLHRFIASEHSERDGVSRKEANEWHRMAMDELDESYAVRSWARRAQDCTVDERAARHALEAEEVEAWHATQKVWLTTVLGEEQALLLERQQQERSRKEVKHRREVARCERDALQTLREACTDSRLRARRKEERRKKRNKWNEQLDMDLNGSDPVKAEQRRLLYRQGREDEAKARIARAEARKLDIELRATSIRQISSELKGEARDRKEMIVADREEIVNRTRRGKRGKQIEAGTAPGTLVPLAVPAQPREAVERMALTQRLPEMRTTSQQSTKRKTQTRLAIRQAPTHDAKHAPQGSVSPEQRELIQLFYSTEPAESESPTAQPVVTQNAFARKVLDWNRLASQCLNDNMYQETARYLKKANFATLEDSNFEFPSETERKRLRATTLNNIGCLHKRLSNHEKALDYLNVVRSTEMELNDASPSTLLNLSALHTTLKRPDAALACCTQAIVLLRDKMAKSMTPTDLRTTKHQSIVAMHNLAAAQAESTSETQYAQYSYGEALRMAQALLGENHQTTTGIATSFNEFAKRSNRVFFSRARLTSPPKRRTKHRKLLESLEASREALVAPL